MSSRPVQPLRQVLRLLQVLPGTLSASPGFEPWDPVCWVRGSSPGTLSAGPGFEPCVAYELHEVHGAAEGEAPPLRPALALPAWSKAVRIGGFGGG